MNQQDQPTDFLLATLGSDGDVNPKIALGVGLKARGHAVSLATVGIHETRVRAAGLDYIEMADASDYEEIMRSPELWHPRKAFPFLVERGMLPLMRPLYDEIAKRDPERTVVVASALMLGARMAQDHLGIRTATVHLQPSVIRSLDDTPAQAPPFTSNRIPRPLRSLLFQAMDRFFIDPIIGPEVNAFRAELGLSPAKGFFKDWLHSPDLMLCLWPEWFAAPQPDWPASTAQSGFVRYDAGAPSSEPSPELAAFLDAGEAPIVFTPGTANIQARAFFEAGVAAIQATGRRALLLTPFREQVPETLPEGILHQDYVPFSEILPRAAALAYHGGVGSLAQAAAAGIPHLVMPMAHDQPDNARRLQELGIGDWLSPRKFKGPAVARKLQRLLDDPEVARRCKAVAEVIDFEASLEESLDLLEELAARPYRAR